MWEINLLYLLFVEIFQVASRHLVAVVKCEAITNPPSFAVQGQTWHNHLIAFFWFPSAIRKLHYWLFVADIDLSNKKQKVSPEPSLQSSQDTVVVVVLTPKKYPKRTPYCLFSLTRHGSILFYCREALPNLSFLFFSLLFGTTNTDRKNKQTRKVNLLGLSIIPRKRFVVDPKGIQQIDFNYKNQNPVLVGVLVGLAIVDTVDFDTLFSQKSRFGRWANIQETLQNK